MVTRFWVGDAGGGTLTLDEASSVVFEMPQAATENGAAQKMLPLDEIADALVRLSYGMEALAT